MCECCGADCKLTNPVDIPKPRDLTDAEYRETIDTFLNDPKWQEFARKLAEYDLENN